MNLLTSPHITWQSRNTFINIYSIITKNYNFLSMTALGHHYSVYYRKMLVRLWYMLNRTLKTNVEPRWPLKSNLELRWPPFLCHVIWAVFATRNARTFVRSEDSETFVRRTSRMKKRAYERILSFGTAQSNTPIGSVVPDTIFHDSFGRNPQSAHETSTVHFDEARFWYNLVILITGYVK